VTRQLIQALGGTVRAMPSDRGGARFELWLPVVEPSAPAAS
jgi:signal transduction histidine kinase